MGSPSFPVLLASASPVSQGAEAKVYKANLVLDAPPVLLKYRFDKKYRHPSLNASLTRSRVAGEARALLKCLRSGVNVPGVRMVDVEAGALGIEWIDGECIRRLLPGGTANAEEEEEEEEVDGVVQGDERVSDPTDALKEYGVSLETVMRLVGVEIAKMHAADVVHGDLTTSNMMLRRPTSFTPTNGDLNTELVLIDFGLSYHSSLVEDKAVDLYVLERAFSSTHPDSEPLFASVLEAYAKQLGKEWPAIGRRLDDGIVEISSIYLASTNMFSIRTKSGYVGENVVWSAKHEYRSATIGANTAILDALSYETPPFNAPRVGMVGGTPTPTEG